ncbi:MAG: hypothetical protein FI734_01070 [SAR202 cluster bacterium]|nr:hypothetical protein [SAR202 cluster bacterium]|tara:strand:- start:2799 stop:3434 length:636 start_codon:yes stop_codon:yes gene_type:complete
MLSKKLTGYLLTIAPILMMAVWIGLWPAPEGANPTYIEEIAAIQADDLAPYFMLLGMSSWITMLIALVFLNRSMNTGGSVASDLAGLGAIVALLAAAASAANIGVGIVAADTTFRGSQELIAAVNDAGSYAFPILLGATGIFTGLAIYLSQSLNRIIGIISTLLGLVLFSSAVISYPEIADDMDLADLGFMLFTLTVVIMGILTLRSKDEA